MTKKKKRYSEFAENVTPPSKPKRSKADRTADKAALDFANDPKTGKPMRMEKEDYNYSMGGPVKKYMEGGKVSKGKKYKQSVRGAGCATRGVRNAKMR